VIRASEVEPEVVAWLWSGRVPFGKLTGLVGDPGLGKSTVALDIVARLSVGAAMPDGIALEPATSLVLSAEDGIADTLVPRLLAAGADTDRVLFMLDTDEAETPLPPRTIPDAIPEIEAVVEEHGVRLVVIDPLGAFLAAGINSWADTAVRGALAPLAAMAERTGAAVLIVAHLNKAASQSAIYRVGGSIGIVAAMRSVILVAKDPDDDDGRVLAPLKANLARSAPSLAFSLTAEDNAAVSVNWHGESDHGAEQLLAAQTQAVHRTKIDEAEAFLRDALAKGPRPATQMEAKAKSLGITIRTLTRAKKNVGVESRKSDSEFDGGWDWWLATEEGQADTKVAHMQSVATFGEEEPTNPHESSLFPKEAKAAPLGDHGDQVEPEGGQSGTLQEKRSREWVSGVPDPEGGHAGDIGHASREVLDL
jgi:RecA-family ATPase